MARNRREAFGQGAVRRQEAWEARSRRMEMRKIYLEAAVKQSLVKIQDQALATLVCGGNWWE